MWVKVRGFPRGSGGENDKRGAWAKAFWRRFSGLVLRVRWVWTDLPHRRIHAADGVEKTQPLLILRDMVYGQGVGFPVDGRGWRSSCEATERSSGKTPSLKAGHYRETRICRW